MRRLKTYSVFGIASLLTLIAAALTAGLHERLQGTSATSAIAARERPAPPPRLYRALLSAEHADAWRARQDLDARLVTMQRTVAALGGELRRGEVRYRLSDDTPRAGMTIEQEIIVTVPAGTAWARWQDDVVRLADTSR